MFMPREEPKVDIFRSAIIDGTTGYARNSAVKKYEWHDEVDALRLICERNGITPLVY